MTLIEARNIAEGDVLLLPAIAAEDIPAEVVVVDSVDSEHQVGVLFVYATVPEALRDENDRDGLREIPLQLNETVERLNR